MALSPNIPTSFVPRPAGQQQFRTDIVGAFGFLAYSILGVAFLLAIAVFIYGRILVTQKLAKDNSLKTAVASIDSNTAENFIRLHERLTFGQSLLGGHTAFSGLFKLLEKVLPTTVRFMTLHVSLDAAGVAKIEGSGVAKTFNALAIASKQFAADGRIKDAIFSGIKINNKDNSVSFLLAATLDQSVTTFSL
jgi:hypothetical protein